MIFQYDSGLVPVTASQGGFAIQGLFDKGSLFPGTIEFIQIGKQIQLNYDEQEQIYNSINTADMNEGWQAALCTSATVPIGR